MQSCRQRIGYQRKVAVIGGRDCDSLDSIRTRRLRCKQLAMIGMNPIWVHAPTSAAFGTKRSIAAECASYQGKSPLKSSGHTVNAADEGPRPPTD